ncbi:MAG: DUF2178 domain-containing protein [Methanobacteriaceae archaeon]|jgi:uncharacterized membrane protein|nr:DUF2178 domain-containing protein [Candidatus Methanorudis spinitermitis]
MKTWIKAFLMFLIFVLVSVVWIIGIIFADFKFFILGGIILCFLSIYVFKNREELKTVRTDDGDVMEDERNHTINEKAGNITYEIIIFLMVSIGVAILTLRDIYPQFQTIAHILLFLTIINFIINKIAKFYYKKKL